MLVMQSKELWAWMGMVLGCLVPLVATAQTAEPAQAVPLRGTGAEGGALAGPGEQLGANGFPADWPHDVSFQGFEMLEPAAGPSKIVAAAVSPSGAVVSSSVAGQMLGAGVTGGGLKSFRIEDLPRVASDSALKPGSVSGTPVRVNVPSAPDPGVSETLGGADDASALDGFGPLPPPSDGTRLWQGFGAQSLNDVRPVVSPVLREAWRRVLLAQSAAPGALPSGNMVPGGWLMARADTLWRMGMTESAWALWRQVGPKTRAAVPELGVSWAAFGLLAGQSAAPCTLARQQALMTDVRISGPWLPVVAGCQALDGQTQALGLSLQVAPASVRQQNADVFMVLDAVAGPDVGAARVALASSTLPLGPLAAALLVAQPALLTPAVLPRLPDMAWRRLRDTEGLPEWLRQQSALLLAEATGLPADAQVAAGRVVAPADWASEPPSVLLARVRGVNPTSGTLPDRAAAVVRAGLWLNDAATVRAWLPWATSGTVPLAAKLLLAKGGEASGDMVNAWVQEQPLNSPQRAAHVRRGLAALEGLGVGIPDTVWASLRGTAAVSGTAGGMVGVADGADPAWRKVLAAQAAGGQVPAVLQLVSEGLAGRPAAQAPAGVVGAAVAALRTVGLTTEAQRLVAEVLVP